MVVLPFPRVQITVSLARWDAVRSIRLPAWPTAGLAESHALGAGRYWTTGRPGSSPALSIEKKRVNSAEVER